MPTNLPSAVTNPAPLLPVAAFAMCCIRDNRFAAGGKDNASWKDLYGVCCLFIADDMNRFSLLTASDRQ